MNNPEAIPALIFGDVTKPIAIRSVYDKEMDVYEVKIYPILDLTNLEPGRVISRDKVGDCSFILVFKTKTSVKTVKDSLEWIKNKMEEKEKQEDEQ